MKSKTKKGIKHDAKQAWEKTKKGFKYLKNKLLGVRVLHNKNNSQAYLQVQKPSNNNRQLTSKINSQQNTLSSGSQTITQKPSNKRQLISKINSQQKTLSSGSQKMKQQSRMESYNKKVINKLKLSLIAKFYKVGELVNISKPQNHLFDAKITVKTNNNDNTTGAVYFMPVITIQNDMKSFNISANLSSSNILSEDEQKQIDTDSLIMSLFNNFTLVSFFRNDEKCFMDKLGTNIWENTNTMYLTSNIISLEKHNVLHDLKKKLAADKATTKYSRKHNCNTRTQFVYTLVFNFIGDIKNRKLYVPILVSYPTYSDNESDEVSYSLITDKSQIPDGITVNNNVKVETLNNMEDWVDYSFHESYVGGGQTQNTPN